MYIPQKRSDGQRTKDKIFIIIAVSIIFAIAVCVSTYFLFRYLRQRQYAPKYLPGKFLKQKWQKWSPGSASYGQVPNQTANGQDTSYPGAAGAAAAPEMQTADVRRETSIRSIMTLPSYSLSPKPTEQVIAREGERAGMDMVVEYPETTEEQEARREEQMDSLYQIRLQRRQALADREARRRERQEARERGDFARLEELNAEARDRARRRRAGTNGAADIEIDTAAALAEHRSRERGRRVSSVSYAEIGHVRHDGSRLRADSHNSDTHDSDRRPLLQGDAGSFSAPSFEPSSLDSRGRSVASSIVSQSSLGGELEPLSLAPTTTHGSSRPVSQGDDGDLGMLNIPPPPEYDQLEWGDAPAYQSPVTGQTDHSRQLPTINRLPSIHVNLPNSMPVSPVTPTQSQYNQGFPTPRGPAHTTTETS
ncbi:uncharacterized protein N7515_006333 [Penicillium bovifimosum]|uniref:Uncharacterized protein n=1 Tax=Penicillium bovifimosum TaxID=126998 RepID=A0A9W9L0N5_9EURO|nr:uncharacterized protein N7515_006333 [Penicillium bovifimosum]KAJ5130294.1 hypothetical protein N7515_006333 [Penicillium bovifimosum]